MDTAAGGPILVGVDAGASKSVALAIRPDGSPVGRAVGAGANPKRHGLEVAAARIATLVERAAGARPPTLVLVAGAGIDRPVHARALEAALAARLAGTRIGVVNDTLAVLRGAAPGAVGLAVPVSSGGNVIGRGPDGRVTDRGHGIFGGGYVLGALAARAARRVDPGVGRDLARSIEAADLSWSGRRPGPEAVHLAARVIDAARAGDRLPARMVDRWCARVSGAVAGEVERLGLGLAPVVVVYGGLAEASPWLADRIRAAVLAGAPGARLVRPTAEPVDGAALLARDAWSGTPIVWDFTPRR